MKNRVSARKIAQALWLSSDASQLESRLEVLSKLAEVLENIDLQNLMHEPALSSLEKFTLLSGLVDGLDDNEITNFVLMLISRHMMANMRGIFECFRDKYRDVNNQLLVRLRSAAKLTKKQLLDIKSLLQNKLNKTVLLEVEVDPALLAGLVIEYSDNLIDCSLENKLTRLAELVVAK